MQSDPHDWLELPFHDRRYITVVEKVSPPSATDADKPDSSTIRIAGARQAAWQAIPLIAVTMIPIVGPLLGINLARNITRQQNQRSQVLRVPRSSLADVDFGPDGWEPNVVYAANPRQPSMYRSLATFHEQLLLHKIAELERLLNALGAKEYSIRHVQQQGRSMAVGARLRAVIGGELSVDSVDMRERKWSGTSDGHEPVLPDGLVWYSGEREWQNLVESRFQGARRSFGFSVRQDEDFGVDARLVTMVKAANLEIGGRFRSVHHVEFEVAGTF